ncbi:DUF3800 domain-containing protein [Rhizobium ruizarguesonis]|uniref:DUF3800 domain-containing protein n=1 Tax=Rhizobium ruizarguesonis TaxID=2081791 RepID=UPI001FDF6F13|nr:DUF3800 domain-containing protein [Rhizobium ruizarguesonis]
MPFAKTNLAIGICFAKILQSPFTPSACAIAMPSTPLILADRLHDYAAFSDESHSDANNRYMVIGGILLRSADTHRFSESVTRSYARFKYPEAIQWKHINKAKMNAYKAVIDVIADHIAARKVDFGCIIFDKTKVDHKRHNENDADKGFFKFLYQHHFKWYRHYKKSGLFRCFHGNMDTKYDVAEMLRCLNNSVPVSLPAVRRPFLQFDFAEVRKTRCSQIADLMIGAVGFAANGGPSKREGTAKADIYDYMREAFACPDFCLDTSYPDIGFHIWNFKL